ncbi:Phosphoglucomutase-like protein 5 [Myotis brandtii]|uniref:Phosphoglucomutase-like protein 5 n=1 Tax=Myotis brandtii TaxID=109478 RepID=S7NKJ3_MYOBR|nr:Phosphoglucomutase-like protein 5 [Myotis brandtii]
MILKLTPSRATHLGKVNIDSSAVDFLPSSPHIPCDTEALQDILDPNPKTCELHKEGEGSYSASVLYKGTFSRFILTVTPGGGGHYCPYVADDDRMAHKGSDHLREKDGLWAVLVWLSIIAARKQSVEEIVRDHWAKFGRHYYCRFDYEGLEPKATYYIMRDLEALVTDKSFIGQQFAVGSHVYSVAKTDSFEYVDPVDGTVTKKQGLRIIFSDASRLIFRLSSSSGMRATIRLYAESYERDPSSHDQEPQAVLSPLIAIALKISQIHERTGRRGPTVIT